MAEESQAKVLSRQELQKALENSTVEQLEEMGRRLARSKEGLLEVLSELESDSKSLQEENESLNGTIDLMMKELRKLNINGSNTVDPQLEEGPLAFVGRYWEKMKPRDSAYQTSEHVGEIKKPPPSDAPAHPTAQEIAQQAGHQVVQRAQRMKGALGPWWQKTQGFINEKQHEISGAVARAKQRAKAQEAKQPRQAVEHESTRVSCGALPTVAEGEEKEDSVASPGGAPTFNGGDSAATAVRAGGAEVAAACAALPATTASAEPATTMPVDAEDAVDCAADAGVLIEAHLKIEDGTMLTLQLGAADRCKDVAQRFVQENSLKSSFQEPLTTWLKKVEKDAVTFPVQVEGDLVEIRMQYSKKP